MNFNDLWVEKYRSKTIDEMVLPSDIREFFTTIKNSDVKNIPHLLFVGEPGTGKSTIAKVIVNDILGCQYLYINASDENGIDTVRGKIMNFIQTKSFDGNIKVVLLDECDGLSKDAQKALRNCIEEYTPYARFILTANYIHKIIEPLLSRCAGGTFYIQPDRKEYIKHCSNILKKENIILPKDQHVNFITLCNKCYPDLRNGINNLQKLSISGTFVYSEKELNKDIEEIAQYCYNTIREAKNIFELREYIITKEKQFNSDYQVLLKHLFEIFYKDTQLDINKKKVILLLIAESMCLDATVLDKEINLFSCIIKIEQTLDGAKK